MPREPQFLTILCCLLKETEKALRLHWDDPENGMDLEFWIPKKCIEEDSDDREMSIIKLRRQDECAVDVATWWIKGEPWFDEDVQELIDLLKD